MTDGEFPTSSTPSFGKMEKQFEEFRHCLEKLGSLLKWIWVVVTEIYSVTRLICASLLLIQMITFSFYAFLKC
uniref:Putative ovule protein n=1 Tax=Solanum chacoense TaxID=4108 RepID=A0A0V0HNH1_SOLCH